MIVVFIILVVVVVVFVCGCCCIRGCDCFILLFVIALFTVASFNCDS